MTEPTCATVRDAAPELALGILPAHEAMAINAHLLRCPECRAEVESMKKVAARVLDLVPGTEPPLGFDRRVLDRVARNRTNPVRRFVARRPRTALLVAGVAAAAAIVFGGIGWMAGRGDHYPHPATTTAVFTQGGRTVGEVYAYPGDKPPWLDMSVHGASGSGVVQCEAVERGGGTTVLGTFRLNHGNGTWGAADRSGVANLTAVRLVGTNGRVVAMATFRS